MRAIEEKVQSTVDMTALRTAFIAETFGADKVEEAEKFLTKEGFAFTPEQIAIFSSVGEQTLLKITEELNNANFQLNDQQIQILQRVQEQLAQSTSKDQGTFATPVEQEVQGEKADQRQQVEAMKEDETTELEEASGQAAKEGGIAKSGEAQEATQDANSNTETSMET